MKKYILILMIFAAVIIAAESKVPVAVIDLIQKSGVSKDTAEMISDYLRTQLVNENKFIVVSRDNMNSILTEQNFQTAACNTEECMVQAGKLLGVSMLFTGTLGKVGTLYLLNIKMLNVETGEIGMAKSEETKNEEGLLEAVKKIVAEIGGRTYAPQNVQGGSEDKNALLEKLRAEKAAQNNVPDPRMKLKNFISFRQDGFFMMNGEKKTYKEIKDFLRAQPATKRLILKQDLSDKSGGLIVFMIVSEVVCVGSGMIWLITLLDEELSDSPFHHTCGTISAYSSIPFLLSIVGCIVTNPGSKTAFNKALKTHNGSLSLLEKNGAYFLSVTGNF